jgi:hypothetical protein
MLVRINKVGLGKTPDEWYEKKINAELKELKFMDVSDLCKEFKNAIFINIDNKTVWLLKNGKCKIYSELFYDKLMRSIDMEMLK